MTARWLALALLTILTGLARGETMNASDQLLAADRRFADDVATGGLPAWLAVMADDAVRLPALGAEGIQGKAAIAAADAGLFADPTRRLTWRPTAAGVLADGDLGYTTGTYRFITLDDHGHEASLLGQGRYLTWWRRGPQGRWQVILDTGEADPSTPPTEPERSSP